MCIYIQSTYNIGAYILKHDALKFKFLMIHMHHSLIRVEYMMHHIYFWSSVLSLLLTILDYLIFNVFHIL